MNRKKKRMWHLVDKTKTKQQTEIEIQERSYTPRRKQKMVCVQVWESSGSRRLQREINWDRAALLIAIFFSLLGSDCMGFIH